MTPPRSSVQVFVVASLALAAFAVSLGGEFVSDDLYLVGRERADLLSAVRDRFWHVPGTGDQEGLYGNAYRPFSQLMFALQTRWFGSDPSPFHAVSLLLHACNSWLVLRWLRRRLRAPDGRIERGAELAALLGAVSFAVHPAHAQSVAWISGATDLWMTFHLLVGFELLERGAVGRALAALAFACAVFSKEPAAVAPALCLLDARTRSLPRTTVLSNTLSSGLGAGAAAAVVLLVGGGSSGAALVHFDVSSALASTGHYVRAALLPIKSTFEAQPFVVDAHGLHVDSVMLALGASTWALFGAALLLGLRWPRARALGADAAWFCLLLLPVVVLLQHMISDRFLYAPLLGVCALFARALTPAFEARPALRYGALLATSAAVLLALAASTRAAASFADEVTLWRSQVAAHPDNPKALDALGEALSARGEHEEAGTCFERGLAAAHAIGQRDVALHFAAHLIALPVVSRPEWDEIAWAQTARGCDALLRERRVRYARGGREVSLDVSEGELRALERPPTLLLIPCTRTLLASGSLDAAVLLARRTVEVAPEDMAAAEIYALSLARSGSYDRALRQVDRGLSLHATPQLADLQARIRAARETARTTLAADDLHGRSLLAFEVALSLGSPRAARAAIARALAATPDDRTLVHALAQSYVAERRFDHAYEAVLAVQRRHPTDPHWEQVLQALAGAQAALAASPSTAPAP